MANHKPKISNMKRLTSKMMPKTVRAAGKAATDPEANTKEGRKTIRKDDIEGVREKVDALTKTMTGAMYC